MEDPLNKDNHCYYFLPKDPKVQEWVYGTQNVRYKAGAKYHVECDVRAYTLGDNKNLADDFKVTVLCNAQYTDPAGSKDHVVSRIVTTYGDGWTHFAFDFTVSDKSRSRGEDILSFYTDPVNKLGVGFLLDNVVVTETPKE